MVKAKSHSSKNFLRLLGPGLITGAADDDPSGIATYSQTGAQYGLQLLWIALFTLPLMVIVQEMCARIGKITGQGISEHIRDNYPPSVIYVVAWLLFAANTFNIGANLAAISQAVQLIFPVMHFIFITIIFAIINIVLQVFISYSSYAKYLKYLTLALFAYVITLFLVQTDWKNVLAHLVIPHITFSKQQIILICAILGTTISPYLFFWQAAQEVEEDIKQGKTKLQQRKGATKHQIREMRIDVWCGMFISNLIMFCIITVCASTLFAHGITDVKTAADAAKALEPFAGRWSSLLFAVGIIGTGMLSIPVLAGSAGYALASAFRWPKGLYKKWYEAYKFYAVITLSMLIALLLNFFHIDPIKSLIYSAVANGILAPVVLFFVVRIANDKKIMGPHANHPLMTWGGWLIMAAMGIAGIATIVLSFI